MGVAGGASAGAEGRSAVASGGSPVAGPPSSANHEAAAKIESERSMRVMLDLTAGPRYRPSSHGKCPVIHFLGFVLIPRL